MARRARKSRAGLERWNHLVACLRLMNFAFNNVRLYPPTHTEVVGAITKLRETLESVLEEMEDVGFGFMDELLYIEGAMSIEETANNQMLVDRFTKCRVKYLTIMKGVSQNDLLEFFKVMNAEATKPSAEPPGELLAKAGVTTLHIVEADVDDVASKSKAGRRRTFLDWYEKSVATLLSAHQQLRDGTGADLKPLYRMVDDMMATIRTKGHEPFLLLPYLARGLDPHACHALNTAVLCCVLGEGHRLNSGQVQTLVVAALLHDLGRCVIPPEWTEDASPLSAFEQAVVFQHGNWGFMLLTRDSGIPAQIGLLAAHHHENPLQAREGESYTPDIFHKILHIADAYDLAAFGDRYYWRQHGRHRVLRSILRRRGKAFDPPLVKLLVNAVGLYPVGSLVRLEDGRRGIVVRANPSHPARPRVFMFEEEAPPAQPAEQLPEWAAPQATAPQAEGTPEEPPPVLCDLADLDEGGLRFKNTIASFASPEPGLDLWAVMDKKKEYLLSYTL